MRRDEPKGPFGRPGGALPKQGPNNILRQRLFLNQVRMENSMTVQETTTARRPQAPICPLIIRITSPLHSNGSIKARVPSPLRPVMNPPRRLPHPFPHPFFIVGPWASHPEGWRSRRLHTPRRVHAAGETVRHDMLTGARCRCIHRIRRWGSARGSYRRQRALTTC